MNHWCTTRVMAFGFTLIALGTRLAAAEEEVPQPDSKDGFTVEDAVQEMERSHPLLHAADHGARAVARDAVDAGLWSNPVFSATYANAWNSSYDKAGYMTGTVTQFLDLAGAPGARRRSAAALSDAALADREGLRVELGLRVEEAAIRLTVARDLATVLADYQTRIAEVVRIVDARVVAGSSPHYDADRIGLVESAAAADLAEARAEVTALDAAFRAQVGPGASRLKGELRYDLDLRLDLPSEQSLSEYLHSQRPEVRAALERLSSSQAGVEAARKAVMPGVALSVGVAFGAAPGQIDLGGGLSVPLPVANRGQGSVRAAEARVSQGEESLRALIAPAESLLPGLRTQIEQREEATSSYHERIRRVRDTMLFEAQAGYQGGRLSVLELSDAYSSWRDARLRGLSLAAAARQSEVDLGRLVGISLRDFARAKARGGKKQ